MFADPVGAAVDSFAKVAGTINDLEERKDRRDINRLVMQRQQKAYEKEDDQTEGIGIYNNLVSVYASASAAEAQGKSMSIDEMNDDQIGAIIKMGGITGFFDETGKVVPEKIQALKSLQNFKQAPEIADAMKNKGRAYIDLTQNKQLGDSLHILYGDVINQGQDAAGNDNATKRATRAFFDFSGEVPMLVLKLGVTPPQEGPANVIPLKGYEKDVYSIPEITQSEGQVERGNIDLAKRKVALNKDGSIDTVLPMSIDENGKAVLIPRVSNDGTVMSPEDAIKAYKATGKHLGVFDDKNSADRYAEQLQNSSIWKPSVDYYKRGRYEAPMTYGRSGSPDDPVKMIPLPLLDMQINSLDKLGGWINQLEAKYGTTEFAKIAKGKIASREESQAMATALSAIDPKASPDVQRKQFIEAAMKSGKVTIKSASETAKNLVPDRKTMSGLDAVMSGDPKAVEAVEKYEDIKNASKEKHKSPGSGRAMTPLEAVMSGDENAIAAVEKVEDIKNRSKSKYRSSGKDKDNDKEKKEDADYRKTLLQNKKASLNAIVLHPNNYDENVVIRAQKALQKVSGIMTAANPDEFGDALDNYVSTGEGANAVFKHRKNVAKAEGKNIRPAGVPPSARLAPDGFWYAKNNNGKYIKYMPEE